MYAYVFLQVEQYLLFVVKELRKYPLQLLLLFPFGMMGAHHSNCLYVTIHGKRGFGSILAEMRLLPLCIHQTFVLQFMYIDVVIATLPIKYLLLKLLPENCKIN